LEAEREDALNVSNPNPVDVKPLEAKPLETKPKRKPNPKAPRQDVLLLEPDVRLEGCYEVALGFTPEQVKVEVLRCLQCKDPKCIDACPLHIDIKAMILALGDGDIEAAFAKISEQSPFPGICGRVCQHELFCEKDCLMGKKLDPVAIGSLERYIADQHRAAAGTEDAEAAGPCNPATAGLATGPRVALVGSGPASLITAFDLVRKGYRVTVFEALHRLGGVLAYGIPNFRLPREILNEEIERLRRMGVEFHTDFIVGKTATLDELFGAGYAAVFLGTGAGLPHLMGIPGENLTGVYTANEFLTRINLMEAYRFPEADTPVRVGKHTVVVGGGNSAMDAARWARRFGSGTTILFRRGRAELRARVEEIGHAEEEGVHFEFLAAPTRLFGDAQGNVCEMECIRMALGEPDESGRPSPVPLPGSEYRVPVDTVVMAIGQSPNPTVQRATPQLATHRGKVVIDASGETSMAHVYAGGDVVRGGSTVILAMRDGRAAAEAIDRALRQQQAGPGGTGPATEPAPAKASHGYRVIEKRWLTPESAWLEIEAPEISRHWKPGQFVILRPTPESERIPLTIVDGDPNRGTIVLVVQVLGKTSRATASLVAGGTLADLLGPLGLPATVERAGQVVCVAGGVGVAELLPVARAFREAGNRVTALCGARSAAQMILDAQLRSAADEVRWATDDGSAGLHGTVVDLMRDWRAGQPAVPPCGIVHVIGPIPMMRAAAALTREWGVRTLASLNPIMVDGTGMCGGCRVTVGGKVKFACVDGPEFDAHGVDFDELARRNRAYTAQERVSRESEECKIGLGE